MRQPERSKTIEVLTVETYRLHVNMSSETKALLDQVLDLSTDRNLDAVLRAALQTHLTELESKKRRTLKRKRKDTGNAVAVAAPVRQSVANEDVAANGDAAPHGLLRETETILDEAPRLQEDIPVGPKGRTRYVPAAVARAVFERDGGRCTFVGYGGRLCGSGRNVELHHLEPFAMGGPTTEANLTCHCKAHNLYQGELDFPGAASSRMTR